MSANDDVWQALKIAWDAANLSVAGASGAQPPIPGGLHSPPLPSPRPKTPYAVLTVKKDARPNVFMSAGNWIDYRRASIVLYGVGKAALGAIVSQVLAGLVWTPPANWVALSIPGADGVATGWMRTEYVSDDVDVKEPVQGEDIRTTPIEMIVWSQRKTF